MNSVSTLVAEGNAPAATKMLSQIAEFLRAMLDNEVVAEAVLSQEMVLAERYLAIEQTRLEGHLHVDFAISPDTLDALVPSLLQPLIENAVRHGIAPLIQGGTITIQSELRDSHLCITVSNSGSQGNHLHEHSLPQAKGIGLRNTAERLKTLYSPDHKFSLEWPTTGGCQTIVELPFRRRGRSLGVTACVY